MPIRGRRSRLDDADISNMVRSQKCSGLRHDQQSQSPSVPSSTINHSLLTWPLEQSAGVFAGVEKRCTTRESS